MNAIATFVLLGQLSFGIAPSASQLRYLTLSSEVAYSGHSRVPVEVIDLERKTIGSEDFRLEYTSCETREFSCIRLQGLVLASPKVPLELDAVLQAGDISVRIARENLQIEMLGRSLKVTVIAAQAGGLKSEIYADEVMGIVAYSVFDDDRLVDNHILMSECGLFASSKCLGDGP